MKPSPSIESVPDFSPIDRQRYRSRSQPSLIPSSSVNHDTRRRKNETIYVRYDVRTRTLTQMISSRENQTDRGKDDARMAFRRMETRRYRNEKEVLQRTDNMGSLWRGHEGYS